MRKILSDYLDEVCVHISNKELRTAVRAELTPHFQKHVAELMKDGLTEGEAARQAVAAMGDPHVLAMRLIKVSGRKQVILLVATLTVAIATIAASIGFLGEYFSLFFDMPSILFVTLIGVALSVAQTVSASFTWHAFWHNLTKTSLLAGAISSLTALITLLASLDNLERLGPFVAVSLLTLFYGVLLSAAAQIVAAWTAPPTVTF